MVYELKKMKVLDSGKYFIRIWNKVRIWSRIEFTWDLKKWQETNKQ